MTKGLAGVDTLALLAKARDLAGSTPPLPRLGDERQAFDRVLPELCAHLEQLQQRCRPRTALPARVRRIFPFGLGVVERLVLRLHRAVFHDQLIAQQQTALAIAATRDALALLKSELARIKAGVPPALPAAPRRATRLPADAPLLFQVEGPSDSSYSLAIVNRHLAFALERRFPGRVAVSPTASEGYATNPPAAERLGLTPLMRRGGPEARPFVSVRNTWPIRTGDQKGERNLLFFFWEESCIHRDWVAAFNRDLDGVVVASEFVRKSLIDSGVAVPIGVIGAGVDHVAVPARRPPRPAGKPVTFLHVSSCFPRKGADVLLAAWAKAFRAGDPVRLIIKTFPNPHNDVPEQLAALRAADAHLAAVEIINEDVPHARILELYGEADVAVLPTRGEGFGLPMAEAMLFELPVIATAHGGHADFCTAADSWPLDFHFAPAGSHLGVPHALWVEPSADDLAGQLRHLAALTQSGAAELGARVAAARARAATMTWDAAAARLVDFVERLPATRGETPLRLAWVSTYNSRCGIAEYSKDLISGLGDAVDVTVLANWPGEFWEDGSRVVRCWDRSAVGILDHVGDADAVVLQFHTEFFEVPAFGALIEALKARGKVVVVTLHRTRDPDPGSPYMSLRVIAGALAKCDRILVHQLDDVNRLKEWGLVANVTLFPLGADCPPETPAAAARAALGLGHYGTVIGSFGFFFAHKGLFELIEAMPRILAARPDTLLLLVNAAYPNEWSAGAIAHARHRIEELGLAGNVLLITDFLERGTARALLTACDILAYPYQNTSESASAAIKMGLAAHRPIVCTPLPIFADLAGIVVTTKGLDPDSIADTLLRLAADPDERAAVVARQQAHLAEIDWRVLSRRLEGLVRGLLAQRPLTGADGG